MQILEQSRNSVILALSDTEIGKVSLPITLVCTDVATGKPIDFFDGGPTLEDEIAALKYLAGKRYSENTLARERLQTQHILLLGFQTNF